jgi:hypothetical protein
LLQPALRNLARVSGLPGFEDVKRIAHKIIGTSGHRVIEKLSFDLPLANLESFRPSHFLSCLLTCNGQRTTDDGQLFNGPMTG